MRSLKWILAGLLTHLLVGNSSAQILEFATFDNGLPNGWVSTSFGTTTDGWNFPAAGYFDGTQNQHITQNTRFALANSNAAGLSTEMDAHLYSPIIDGSQHSNIFLEFDHIFKALVQGDSAILEVFDGTNWQRLDQWGLNVGDWGSAQHDIYNLTPYLNPALQVRFIYRDNGAHAWFWGIDNVRIEAQTLIDLRVSKLLSPAHNGRVLTSSALTSNEPIRVEITNDGTSPATNFFMQYNLNGVIIGPETYTGTLAAGAKDTFTFNNTADLSLVDDYTITAWTSIVNDLNVADDTLSPAEVIRQLPNPLRSLPFSDNFNDIPFLDIFEDTLVCGIGNRDFIDFRCDSDGHLQTFLPINQTAALSLDRINNGPEEKNEIIFTFNLSQKDANVDSISISLSLRMHGGQSHNHDKIWIRGSDTDPWIEIMDWSAAVIPGIPNTVTREMSSHLITNGQNYSSSFQVKVGQEGTSVITAGNALEGLTIDNLFLNQSNPSDLVPYSIVSPRTYECGDSVQNICVGLRNEGVDTIFSAPVAWFWEGPNGQIGADTNVYFGTLPPGAQDTACFGGMNTSGGGVFDFTVVTQLNSDDLTANDTLFGSADLRPLNIPQFVTDSICIGDSAMIYALPSDLFTSFTWYDSIVGGNLIHVGDTIQTGVLTGDTTFYLETNSTQEFSVGENSPVNLQTQLNFPEGMFFEVYHPIILDSVKVYAASSGTITIHLLESGIEVQTATFPVVSASTSNPIWLEPGFFIPPGVEYEVKVSATGVGLQLEQNGNYPFDVLGLISIYASSGPGSSTYNYLFDWQIRTAECPTSRTPVRIEVNDSVVAGFTWADVSNLVGFTDTSLQEPGSFFWDFGDNNTSGDQDPFHTFAIDGEYEVCMTASNGCSSDQFCDTVTVCESMNAGFEFSASGLSLTFLDTSIGQPLSWEWDFGDANTGIGPSPVNQYAAAGTYAVTLIITNFCGESDTLVQSIDVCEPLSAAFSSGTNDGITWNFTDLSTGGILGWIWDFDDGIISSLQSPSHSFASPGFYTVSLQVYNICGDTAETSTSIFSVGQEEELESQINIHAFPNPFNGELRVNVEGLAQEDLTLEVLDATGRLIFNREVDASASSESVLLQLHQLPAGAYLLRVRWQEQARILRVIKS